MPAEHPAARVPGKAFCEGGTETCEVCVGSCGIEEYIEEQEARSAAQASWCDGWKVGERVCVHGEGFGRIVRLVDREVHPYAVVEIPRLDVHEPSGQKISWTDTVTVSLDVYPAHMSRSAA